MKWFKDNLKHYVTIPKTPIDYSLTPISFYHFVCNDPEITSTYVGHTTNFRKRKNQHKSACNVSIEKNNIKLYKTLRENGGFENWKMIELEKRICVDKRDAERFEQEWIDKLQSKLNTNKAFGANNKLEYPRMQRELHKELLTEYHSKYYHENKEKITLQNKEYVLRNKEKTAEYKKQRYESNKEKLSDESKKYYLLNKEKLIEKSAKYYKENKTEALNKQKEYALVNKDKIQERKTKPWTCECGSTCRHGDKSQHFKSKKHQEFINSKA